MARAMNKLTPKTVAALSKTGNFSDGGGLYLQISAYGSKNWVFRFTLHGRKREMGLPVLLGDGNRYASPMDGLRARTRSTAALATSDSGALHSLPRLSVSAGQTTCPWGGLLSLRSEYRSWHTAGGSRFDKSGHGEIGSVGSLRAGGRHRQRHAVLGKR